MKNMLRLGLSLAAFASVACVLLALVNNATEPVIAAARRAEVDSGLSVVFPDADSFAAAEDFVPDTATAVKVESLYLARKGGSVAGAVVQASGPTYDKATVLLGLDMERRITGVQFLSISDTPGFGQKATEPWFYTQFAGKSADDAFVAGDDVDMISGATITTRGVVQIVRYASYAAGKFLADNHGAAMGSGDAPAVAEAASAFGYDEAYRSLFPAEKYPGAVLTELTDGLHRVVRTMVVEKQVVVAVDGVPAGAMVAVRGQTYKTGGVVLTAVAPDGRIIGARIIEINDTPNLGQRVLEEEFYSQFDGKNASDALLAGVDFDVVSGATISSACVADMVKVGAVEADALLASVTGKAAASSDDYQLNEIYREE